MCIQCVHAFPSCLLGLYSEVYVNKWPGAPFFGSLHPAGAKNKSSISNTVTVMVCLREDIYKIDMCHICIYTYSIK